MENLKNRTGCIRCGECCLESSPTLQASDINLVNQGFIEKGSLYTIRTGELVKDPVENRLLKTDRELIKIKEKREGRGCVYYKEEEKACGIYEHRPSQCSAFACWDLEEFLHVYGQPKASRGDLIIDASLLKLVDQHRMRCGYDHLEQIVAQIESRGEEAVVRVLELIRFDHDLRPLVTERLGIDPDEMDFLLGRPLTETIRMFGLRVLRERDGSFLLTLLDEQPRDGEVSIKEE